MISGTSENIHPTEGQGGHAIFKERQFRLDHWEIFAADRHNMVRGWFSCHGADFSPARTTRLHIGLVNLQGERLELDVEITVAFKAANLWEFQIVA